MILFDFETEKQWDYENGFNITSDISRFGKLIAHYELYKKITELPGVVIEAGVFKAGSLIRFATYRELFEFSYSRKIIGFDAFGSFPRQKNKTDNEFAQQHDEIAGKGIQVEELNRIFKYKGIRNIDLIKGDINKTVPKYIVDNPSLKIALLHIDVDVYDPTKTVLDCLYDKVVRNGITIFDDYSQIEGETNAVDDFFSDKECHFKKLKFSHSPTYVVKE